MIYKLFNERTKGSGINNKVNLLVNSQLAEELHKPIIKNFKRRKVYSSFKDNIWSVDLADMQLISNTTKETYMQSNTYIHTYIHIFYVLLIYLVHMLGLLF